MSEENSLDEPYLTKSIDFKTYIPYSMRPRKRKGRTPAVQFKNEVISYKPNNFEERMPKGNKYFDLCGKLYAVCRHVGDSINLQQAYQLLSGEEYEYLTRIQKGEIYERIRQINRYAKRRELPKLFEIKDGRVYRRGT